jgi:hypothetical protein
MRPRASVLQFHAILAGPLFSGRGTYCTVLRARSLSLSFPSFPHMVDPSPSHCAGPARRFLCSPAKFCFARRVHSICVYGVMAREKFLWSTGYIYIQMHWSTGSIIITQGIKKKRGWMHAYECIARRGTRVFFVSVRGGSLTHTLYFFCLCFLFLLPPPHFECQKKILVHE